MKRYSVSGKMMLSVAAIAALVAFMSNVSFAKSASAKDERKLKTEITMLNKDAALPRGEQVVMDKLTREFSVSSDRITALRDKKLGFGEIAAVLALADKMSGGINDANIDRVTSMHESGGGWAKLAKSLNVDLGSVASKVAGLEDSAHKDIKKAAAEGTAAGSGAGGGKAYDSGKRGGKGY